MSVIQKLRGLKKGWYVLIALVLILVMGVGVKFGLLAHNRADLVSRWGQMEYRQVCTDLLYLENFATLKVTPDEARVILPMLERMSSTTDNNVQMDLAKQIYGQLSPAQYAALLEQPKGNGAENNFEEKEGEKYARGEHNRVLRDYRVLGKNARDAREQALGNVVIKMLTDRSQGKS